MRIDVARLDVFHWLALLFSIFFGIAVPLVVCKYNMRTLLVFYTRRKISLAPCRSNFFIKFSRKYFWYLIISNFHRLIFHQKTLQNIRDFRKIPTFPSPPHKPWHDKIISHRPIYDFVSINTSIDIYFHALFRFDLM